MSKPASPQGGATPALPATCQTEVLGVAFFDLSRISEWASSENDEQVAAFFQTFYELAATHLEPAGARIVKFMGDAGLVVFPKDAAEQAILALAAFATQARATAGTFGLDTYLNVNVHVGPVITGEFGPASCRRYDVIGKTVNIAARLGRRGVTLSAQAFRCLSPDVRRRFEKCQPPVTYRFRG